MNNNESFILNYVNRFPELIKHVNNTIKENVKQYNKDFIISFEMKLHDEFDIIEFINYMNLIGFEINHINTSFEYIVDNGKMVNHHIKYEFKINII